LQIRCAGDGEARIENLQQTEQYLVSRRPPRCTCTCFELQEMGWPCKHIMKWDNLEGKDFMRHFHKCSRTSSLKALYAQPIPSFLCNDLAMRDSCLLPAIAVKKDRHRVVRMQSKTQYSRPDEGAVRDELGYLCRLYPIEDDPTKIDPMPSISSTFLASRVDLSDKDKSNRKSKRPNTGKTKCRKCHGVGHNVRTCKATSMKDMPEEFNISSFALVLSDAVITTQICFFRVLDVERYYLFS
jgi:hypothetical protein